MARVVAFAAATALSLLGGTGTAAALVTPTIDTEAQDPSVVVGEPTHASAGVSSSTTLSGSLIFRLYGPDDPSCAGTPQYVSPPVSLDPAARFTFRRRSSPDFAPPLQGAYTWVASYSGDAANNPVTSSCADPDARFTAWDGIPYLIIGYTSALAGEHIAVSSTLGSGVDPSGTIGVRLFGPSDPSCSGTPLLSEELPVEGNGSYDSTAYQAVIAGTYTWSVSYSGDAHNLGSEYICSATVDVHSRSTSMSAEATGGPLGELIHSTALLQDGFNPGGTIVFKLYNNESCTGSRVYQSEPIPVSGNGEYESPGFAPSTTGVYRWTATYSGDGANAGSISGCEEAKSAVWKVEPTITLTSSPSVMLGEAVWANAELSGGRAPVGGSITFRLFAPSDHYCTGPLIATRTVPVSGNGPYGSGSVTPDGAGYHTWTATYNGDSQNAQAYSDCPSVLVKGPTPAPPVLMADPPVPLTCKRGRTLKKGKCVKRKRKHRRARRH